MTKFCDIELLYNQFFNLEEEIRTLIEVENYDEASIKVEHKSRLMAKLFNAQKTADLNSEEKIKLQELTQKLKEMDKFNIRLLMELKNGVEDELKSTKQKVKVNSAYSVKRDNENGVFFDVSD